MLQIIRNTITYNTSVLCPYVKLCPLIIFFFSEQTRICTEENKTNLQQEVIEEQYIDSHVQLDHDDDIEKKPFVCVKCDNVFHEFASLISHQKHSHPHFGQYILLNKPGKGRQLLYIGEKDIRVEKSNRIPSQPRLVDNSKNSLPNPCPVCDRQLNSQSALTFHLRQHVENTRYVCDVCSWPFYSYSAFVTHKRKHEQRELTYPCGVCQQKFGRYYELEDHYKESGHKPFSCDFCSKRFTAKKCLKEHLLVHKMREDPSTKFACDVCNKTFLSLSSLQNHTLVHSDKSYLCNECGEQFYTPRQMKHHKLIKHSAVHPFQCTICHKTFTKYDTLKLHKQYTHSNQRNFLCHTCGAMFKFPGDLTAHKRRKCSAKKFHREESKCDICDKTLSSKQSLQNHKMNFHEEKKMEHLCHECGKSFNHSVNLKHHQANVHNPRRHEKFHSRKTRKPKASDVLPPTSFPCDECGETFHHIYHLKRHKIARHEKDKYFVHGKWVCDVCNKSFKSVLTLRGHKKRHLVVDKYKYACDQCDKTFCAPVSLADHKRMHSGERPFSCDVCLKSFYARSSMLSHRKRKHFPDSSYRSKEKREGTFACDMCDKSFFSQATLDAHKLSHFGLKKFHCSQCKKGFDYSYSLEQHMRIHTGEKPYLCDVCSKSYYSAAALKLHTRQVHSNQDTSFICPQCGKQLMSKGSLKTHIRMHNGWKRVKKHSCSICGDTFSLSSALAKHVMLVHSDNPTVEYNPTLENNLTLENNPTNPDNLTLEFTDQSIFIIQETV